MSTSVLKLDELEACVTAAVAGDTNAFARVVGATSSLVTSIALAIVRDVDLSQEIAQDVFLSAWRDLRKLRNPASFLPWLRQMARNRAHSTLRSRVRARRWMLPMREDHEVEAIVDGRAGVTECLLDAERGAALREALAALPDDAREVLALYYREGQSAAQVGALLDLSEGAVKKRLSRARAALREGVMERLGETLGGTAPGVTFTTAVMAALPLAAPASASAMTLAASKAGSGAGSSAGLWAWSVGLFKAVAAVAVTSVGGVLGVVLGGRQAMRAARDVEERRQLRRFKWANITAVVAAAIGFELRSWSHASEWADLAVFGAFTVALASLHLLWLPRIVRSRFEAEMREDAARARARRRRERRLAVLAWTLVGGLWLALVLKIRW